ncbi:MAG: hypothetical protein GC172_00225 [Phycisphaera sp.]|nr:hypothetical protein [Phycisphaera sp.]
MRAQSKFFVGLFLSATLSASALAGSDWEVVALADGKSPANINGIANAVWVPNQFNNPAIGQDGTVYFRGLIAGPGITNLGATANHIVLVKGDASGWSVIARNNAGVPGGTPAGAIFSRTASPNNSIVSANNISEDGGVLVSGFMTGPTIINSGTTTQNDTAMWFVPANGSPVLLAQRLDSCPGTAGALYSTAMTAGSGQRTNSLGQSLFSVSLTGGDTVTANNSAIVLLKEGADELVMRKGDPAPGLDGLAVNPDSFGLFLNGSTVLFSGKLVGSGISTANDSVYLTSAGSAGDGVRIFAREGDPIPGFKGLTIANTSSLAFGQRPLANDGTITFVATLGGSATALDNSALMTENAGTFTILLRRGDAIPGITDSVDPNFAGKVFSVPNSTGFVRNRNGLLAFEGILMNADGTPISSPAPSTFFGVRKADGTIITVARQGDPVPSLPDWTMGSLSGTTSLCVSDTGTVVFRAGMSKSDQSESGDALLAWDEAAGLRLLAKASSSNAAPFPPTGDTNFTGTPINQLSLIGSTGNNGDGGHTGFSTTGWLVVRAGDTANGRYAIARIFLGDDAAGCPADVNNSGAVDATDLAAVLAGWGTTSPDIDGDGSVNAADLAALLAAWGSCN